MTKPVSTKPKSANKSKKCRSRTVSSKQSTSKTRLSGEEVREMRRLAEMLPTGMRAANPLNDPMLLIHNTTQYINQLTTTLLARVQSGSVSPDVLKHLPIPDSAVAPLSATFRSRPAKSKKPNGQRTSRK